MSIRLIIALIVAVGLAASHWKAYVSGKTAERTEWNMRTIKANDDARELERLNRQSKEVALENQKRALVRNIADINLALAESDGLRDDSERSLQAARENHAACLVSATAHKELLGACEGRYTELAGKAQGHVTDIKALTEAWPQ